MVIANMPSTASNTIQLTAVCGLLAGVLERAIHLFETAVRELTPEAQIATLRHRLAPDMFSLAHQVKVLSDSLLGAAALLQGVTPREQPAVQWVFNRGDEDSLGRLDENLDAAIKRLKATRQAVLDLETTAAAKQPLVGDAPVIVERRGHRRRFTASAFVDRYVIPNAYFHLSMIYALLRASGVHVGKADFEGPPAYVVD